MTDVQFVSGSYKALQEAYKSNNFMLDHWGD